MKQYCEDGYNLSDGKCIKIEIKNASSKVSCPDNYTLRDDNICYANGAFNKIVIEENHCLTTIEDYRKSFDELDENGNFKYTKDYVGEFKGYLATSGEYAGKCIAQYCDHYNTTRNECDQQVTIPYSGTIYGCPSDSIEDGVNFCRKISKPLTVYECESGYTLNKDKCEKVIEKNPIND